MLLYHGSNDYYKVLKPHVSTHGKSAVYASPKKEHALCFAGNKWTDELINMSYYDGVLYLTELEDGVFDKIYNRSGYIYTLDNSYNKFEYVKESSPHELWCFEDVHYIKLTYLTNILQTLKQSCIILSKFPKKPFWWS